MELITVYDPKGEPFEVQHELASTLVLNKGWSKTPPARAIPPASFAPAPAKKEVIETPNLADRIIADGQAHIAGASKT